MLKAAALSFLIAGVAAACSDPPSSADSDIHVSNVTELLSAVSSAHPGDNIVLAPGEYELLSTLSVPDGTTLTGGKMIFAPNSKLPSGIDPATRAVLKAASTLTGDVVELADRTTLKGLVITDAVGRTGGSAVVVHSRRAGDQVTANLEDCEIVNPNAASSSPQSVGGRALVVLTRNRVTITSEFAPEIGARVSVTMSHSIVRSPRIAGVFVNNFSPGARTTLTLIENVIGGGVQLTGGTSRPDQVSGSTATLESRGNLYRADSGSTPPIGLQVYGGAGLPTPGVAVETTVNNSATLHSVDDRIEGFVNAIVARGGSRPLANSSAISSNSATVELVGTSLSSSVADLNLAGVGSLVAGTWPDRDNVLSVSAQRVTGSGPRNNFYGHVAGPPTTAFDQGNQLQIVGTLENFTTSNSGIMPMPPRQFFTVASSVDR